MGCWHSILNRFHTECPTPFSNCCQNVRNSRRDSQTTGYGTEDENVSKCVHSVELKGISTACCAGNSTQGNSPENTRQQVQPGRHLSLISLCTLA